MAREVTTDDQGLANGVSYIDKTDGSDRQVRASIVVIAASACESARLLLNSRTPRFANGLANSSGAVGKYLMDSTGTDAEGYFPQLEDMIPHNEDGAGGMHLYMPWWLDNRKLDFARGYHIEFGGGRDMPRFGFLDGIEKTPNRGGWGASLKNAYRRYYGATIGFSGRGEMIPNEHSYCEIDPETVDRWGIPVLRFHFRWSDHERLQVKHMHETFHEIIHQAGGTPTTPMPTAEEDYGILAGGRIIHEVGVTRMGDSRHTSVLNEFCQAHDVKNLFVVDGGSFVSNPDKNPTWTILALSLRASEYIAEERRKGNL
jgi:choline dehydrogenase-like flavoprotein